MAPESPRALDAARDRPGPDGPQQALDGLAARVLVGLSAGFGALLLLTGLLQQASAAPGAALPFGGLRLGLGSVLLLGGGAGWLALQRGAARRASFGLLGLWIVAVASFAGSSGLGVHSLALGGGPTLIALGGILLRPAAAVSLALLNMLLIGLLYAAEQQGLIGGASLLPAGAPPLYRLLVHGGMSLGGLLAALLLAKLIGGGLARSLQQEQRLAQLLDLGSDWSWELDLRGKLVSMTPSFEQRTGRTLAEFMRLGEPGGPVVLDDGDWRQVQQALRAQLPFREMLAHYRCADGHVLSVRASGDLKVDARGRPVGWTGVSRNVSAEVQQQAALRRSQAMLERLFRLTPDAISVASLRDGRILLLNESFSRITGYSEAEIVGRSAMALGLWRDPTIALTLSETLARDGRLHDLRCEVWTRSGERRDMLLTAGAFEWDNEPVAVITARDMTGVERERAQMAAILHNASVGIALVRERRFERVNPQFQRMFGRPGESLEGQSVEGALLDARVERTSVESARSRLAGGQSVNVDRRIERPDGSVLVANLRGRPVDPQMLTEAGTIWVAEDITERQQAAQALAEARNAAEAASQAKSAFLASMSHEIRTPLNGVLGLARLLQEPQLDEARRQEYLAHLVESAEGLAGLVSDVLDLSKIEAGRLQLEQLPFDPAALAESTFRSFATLGRERGLQMRCEIAPGLPPQLQGDPVRLRQIVSNYLANALKFTAAGRVTLRLFEAAPGRLRLEVEDTGIGIAPAAQARLFQAFEQADGSTTRRFGGTGLGLSICRQLAQLMDGAVGVHSEEGRGSCFWFEMPLHASEAGASQPAALTPALPLAGLRVLVVEDNHVNMLIITALLRTLGAEAVEANDGEQALLIAREMHAELDAVLMDLHMPVLDGLGAARRLAADPRTQALPVIALSAAVLESERQQALAAGMVDFVPKPVHEAELRRALLKLRRRPAS